ncbi:MAG: hypothetical protein HZA36_00080 [Parcubacteria group bacterium]|nr:hypothetical protein [Parcubacteria group bacterium]
MPCNIGFKSYAKIEVPEPQPQVFTSKSEAPTIDADLLEKLGEEDPEFLEWASGLDTRPLLEEALKRVLAKTDAKGIDFLVDKNGMLEAKGSFITEREKRVLRDRAATVSNDWQFEILGIVAELLNYSVRITKNGEERVLEAEEEGGVHPCNSINVTRRDNTSTLTFEHFKTRKALTLETAKFLALADRLGVKIALRGNDISEGDPFPNEARLITGHKHAHGEHS